MKTTVCGRVSGRTLGPAETGVGERWEGPLRCGLAGCDDRYRHPSEVAPGTNNGTEASGNYNPGSVYAATWAVQSCMHAPEERDLSVWSFSHYEKDVRREVEAETCPNLAKPRVHQLTPLPLDKEARSARRPQGRVDGNGGGTSSPAWLHAQDRSEDTRDLFTPRIE